MVTKTRFQELAGLLKEDSSELLKECDPGESGFRAYLDKKNNKLSPEEYVEHRNYLKRAQPVVKQLESLKRKYVNDRRRFTEEEAKVLSDAIEVLKRSLVPIALIEKEEEEPIILLGDM